MAVTFKVLLQLIDHNLTERVDKPIQLWPTMRPCSRFSVSHVKRSLSLRLLSCFIVFSLSLFNSTPLLPSL